MLRDFFSNDHREIDAIFDALVGKLTQARTEATVDGAPLAKVFDELHGRLLRHIRWEEDELFPAVERRAPDLADGPGRVMREEHVEIRDWFRKAQDGFAAAKLGAAERQAIVQALRSAQGILAEHNEKEETIYYPMADEMLLPDEAAGILERIRQDL